MVAAGAKVLLLEVAQSHFVKLAEKPLESTVASLVAAPWVIE